MPVPKGEDGLTDKQRLFVAEYIIDFNATQAAVRAGYSKDTAFAIGHENLKKPKIAEFIGTALAEREQRTQITQDLVLEGLLTEARLDGEGSTHSARVTAWTQLGRHLAMFTDKEETTHGISDDLAQLCKEIDGLRRSK